MYQALSWRPRRFLHGIGLYRCATPKLNYRLLPSSPTPSVLQMFCQFVADEQQAVRAAAGANEHQSDAAVQAGSLGGADSSSAASSSGGGGSGMGVRRRLRRMWQCWEQQRVQGAHAQALEGQHPGEGPTPQAALEGLQRWPQWGIPLLLAGFCWHSIDTIL